MTETKGRHVLTPPLAALELKSFAEGVQMLVEQLEAGSAKKATKEQRTAAEQAALAILRNSPNALRAIRKLEGCAHEVIMTATDRRDEIMTSMFGPDTA